MKESADKHSIFVNSFDDILTEVLWEIPLGLNFEFLDEIHVIWQPHKDNQNTIVSDAQMNLVSVLGLLIFFAKIAPMISELSQNSRICRRKLFLHAQSCRKPFFRWGYCYAKKFPERYFCHFWPFFSSFLKKMQLRSDGFTPLWSQEMFVRVQLGYIQVFSLGGMWKSWFWPLSPPKNGWKFSKNL